MKITVESDVLDYIKTAQILRLSLNENSNKNKLVTLQDMYFSIILKSKKYHDNILYFYLKWLENSSNHKEMQNRNEIKNQLSSLWSLISEDGISYNEIHDAILKKDNVDIVYKDKLFSCLIGLVFYEFYQKDINDIVKFINLIFRLTNRKMKTNGKINKAIDIDESALALLTLGPYELVYNYLNSYQKHSITNVEYHINITKDMIAYTAFLSSKYFITFFYNINNTSFNLSLLRLMAMVRDLSFMLSFFKREDYMDILDNIKDRESQCMSIISKKLETGKDEKFNDIMTAFGFKFGDIEAEKNKKELKDFEEYLKHADFITNMFDYIEDSKKVILGRDEEVKNTLISLSKKTKSNVILIGQPGTGKTAIVEELTRQIKYNEIPKFEGYSVMEINITSLVAGTKYRGELEQKLNDFIGFMMKRKNLKVILFIDEIHKIMGAGSTEESPLDVSNMLKPLLARDNIKLIGATTLDEYEKYICRDKALMRRFDTLMVKEPTVEKVYDMISAKVEILKKYHNINISKSDVDYVIDLASRRMKSRYFPDKALDIIDYCMAQVSFENDKGDFNRDYVEKYIDNIKEDNVCSVGFSK